MKITKSELTQILKEETNRFSKNPDEKYIKLLETSVLEKTNALKDKVVSKLNEVKKDNKEKEVVLEEVLKQLEKIYSIL